jgi:coenzyme PQQ precursor peptide PqqA
MEWKKPEFIEISLACEISSYANAELGESTAEAERVRDPEPNE